MFCVFLLVFWFHQFAYFQTAFVTLKLSENCSEKHLLVLLWHRAMEQVEEVKGDTYTPHIILKVYAIESRRTTLNTLALG